MCFSAINAKHGSSLFDQCFYLGTIFHQGLRGEEIGSMSETLPEVLVILYF